MIRKAFCMEVHPDKQEEYRRRHNPIWPELESVLKSHGVRCYSIFLHPQTNQLFGYVEIDNLLQWERIAEEKICQRWWLYMRDLMPTNNDHSPKSIELVEVFRLP